MVLTRVNSWLARSAAVVTKVALADLHLAFRRLSTGTDGRRDARTSITAVDLQANCPGENTGSLFISIWVFRRTALPPTLPDCREEVCAPRQNRCWPAADWSEPKQEPRPTTGWSSYPKNSHFLIESYYYYRVYGGFSYYPFLIDFRITITIFLWRST